MGIGLHNLREGLTIGAAFALGEAALGTFLVLGFTLHITEGVGIAAPILKEKPKLTHFVGLALLGGGPAILGTWIRGFAYSNLAAVILSIGAGAGSSLAPLPWSDGEGVGDYLLVVEGERGGGGV